MKNKDYHPLRTVPKFNTKLQKKAKSIPLIYIYIYIYIYIRIYTSEN